MGGCGSKPGDREGRLVGRERGGERLSGRRGRRGVRQVDTELLQFKYVSVVKLGRSTLDPGGGYKGEMDADDDWTAWPPEIGSQRPPLASPRISSHRHSQCPSFMTSVRQARFPASDPARMADSKSNSLLG